MSFMKSYEDVYRPDSRQSDRPGHTENNPVFIYLNVFHDDKREIKDFEDKYRLGKVGDIEVKRDWRRY